MENKLTKEILKKIDGGTNEVECMRIGNTALCPGCMCELSQVDGDYYECPLCGKAYSFKVDVNKLYQL